MSRVIRGTLVDVNVEKEDMNWKRGKKYNYYEKYDAVKEDNEGRKRRWEG